MRLTATLVGLAAALVWLVAAQQRTPDIVYAPKPDQLPKYTPPHKPHTKLVDAIASHKGQKAWTQLVVDDEHLHGEYVQTAPGTKTPKALHPDTREWWMVIDGQLRFEIENQEPFVASKGSIVNVPYQTYFTEETIGDKPALAFEVNIAGARTLYANQEDAPKIPGFHWMPVKFSRAVAWYKDGNKPHSTWAELAENVEKRNAPTTQRVIVDDRAVGNFIYGYEKKLPPLNPNDKGHYHPQSSEFWFIMSGQIRYPIEGQGVIIADYGDVVYVPKWTFHAPRFYGEGPSTRFAMNGFYNIAHLFEAK